MEKLKKLDDKTLIARIVNGEKPLYELLVRRFNPYLYKIGRSYNYTHEDTQDLMQESFVDAYKNLSSFEGRSSFKTWLVRIMLNNCYRKAQKASYQKESSQEPHENAKPMFANLHEATEKKVQNRELKYIIEAALAQLPLNYRMVFSLREINALSTAETAQVIDISEDAVKKRLSRAKTMLRTEIEKSYTATELFEFNLIYCDAIVEKVMKKIENL